MNLYDLVHINSKDYRKLRIEGLIKYSWAVIKTGDVDPAYPLLSWIMDELSLDTEERYWLCFLYGHFYHVACAYWVFINFPNIYDIDLNELRQWENENYRRLEYQDDRKRERGKFAKCVESYIKQVNKYGSQKDMFRAMMTKDKYQSFMNIYRWCREKIYGFGRYTAFYYTETLARCMNHNLDAPEIFYPEAESPRLGMQYALNYFPQRINYDYLNKSTEQVLSMLKRYCPEADHMYFESCLCAYKGLWKRRRYIGYYIDRSQEEIIAMEKNTGEDFSRLWQAREEVFPHYMLGELNGWQGRRKHLYNVFANTGKLVNLDLIEHELGVLPDVPNSLCL